MDARVTICKRHRWVVKKFCRDFFIVLYSRRGTRRSSSTKKRISLLQTWNLRKRIELSIRLKLSVSWFWLILQCFLIRLKIVVIMLWNVSICMRNASKCSFRFLFFSVSETMIAAFAFLKLPKMKSPTDCGDNDYTDSIQKWNR